VVRWRRRRPGTARCGHPVFRDAPRARRISLHLGNRDGAIGPEQPFQDYDLPGTFIPEDDTITVAGETFTQNPELVEDETILVNHYWHPELLEHFAGRPTSLVIYTPAGTRTRLSTPHSSTGRLIMARMLFSARTSSSRLHLTVRGRSISEISGRFGKGSVPSIRHSVYSSSPGLLATGLSVLLRRRRFLQ